MANDLVHVRNVKTGSIGDVRRSIFEHPVFNPGVLVAVDADAKPYVSELYRPKDADTFLKEKASSTKTVQAKPPVDTDTKDAD